MKILKKILTLSLFLISIFTVTLDYSYADCEANPDSAACQYARPDVGGNIPNDTGTRTIDVTVTEKMPGLDCTQAVRQVSDRPRDAIPIPGRYVCKVPVGMEGALLVLGRMIRFLTGFALVCAVLFLVFNGMRLTTSGVDTEAKGKVKSQIMMTLGGIILLLLSGPILRLIAPWVYR